MHSAVSRAEASRIQIHRSFAPPPHRAKSGRGGDPGSLRMTVWIYATHWLAVQSEALDCYPDALLFVAGWSKYIPDGCGHEECPARRSVATMEK
jgi:hypothetical protein